MPVHHAVLALLSDGASYGYQLKASFEQSVGPQWGELNIGHLYQVLERLERDKLVTKRVVPQADRPDRVVYRLTPAGQAELESWLATPFVRPAYRDDLFLKLFAAARMGGGRLGKMIRKQREAYLGELRALAKLRREHRDEPLVMLLIDAAVLHTKADLRLLELAERESPRLLETGSTQAEAEGERRASAG